MEGLVGGIGPNAWARTVEEAADSGEVVMAIPFGRYAELPAKKLSGKVF